MLLKQINKAYWYIGLLTYVIFSFAALRSVNYLYLHLTSLVLFVCFGIVLSCTCAQKRFFFTKSNLMLTTFVYSLFAVGLCHSLSYNVDGDIFVFSKADAIIYFNKSMLMSRMSVRESFAYLSDLYTYDDWGAFLWLSTIFRIIPSQIFLSLSYCILGTISAEMLFNIGRSIMPRRYAYIAALSFSSASFTFLLHAMCLKETVMVFCIIAAFNSFYSFLRSRNAWHLIVTLLWSASILFFRVPVSLFLIFSCGVTLVIMYSRGVMVFIFVAVMAVLLYSSSFLINYTYDRYLHNGNTKLILERKMELAGDGKIVNQVADPLAAVIGPFPSVVAKMVNSSAINVSGLLYRLLLAGPFFLGVIYAFRHKCKELYPLIFFFLVNAIGVAISVKGLEARLSLPHLAMMYLVAFWLLAKYDYHKVMRQLSWKLIFGWFASVLIICILWNLRLF